MKISITQAPQHLPGKATPIYRDGAAFKNFSNDFVTWVVFYGPQGGEKT
jgi:hypothetical protein